MPAVGSVGGVDVCAKNNRKERVGLEVKQSWGKEGKERNERNQEKEKTERERERKDRRYTPVDWIGKVRPWAKSRRMRHEEICLACT